MRLNLYVLILAASFMSISVFGFFAMGHAVEHGSCIAATLQGRVCMETDVFGVAAYHLSAFQKAGRAVLADMGALATFFVFAALLLLAAALKSISEPNIRLRRARGVFGADFHPPQKISFWRWLAFHENSPNVSFAR